MPPEVHLPEAILGVDISLGKEQIVLRAGVDMRHTPPVTQYFDENVARTLLQMRIADFLVKPVAPIDLVRACARVAKGQGGGAAAPRPFPATASSPAARRGSTKPWRSPRSTCASSSNG